MTGETPGDSESRWMSPEELASAIGSVIKKIELVVAQPKDINVNNLVPYATFSEESGISSVVAATPPGNAGICRGHPFHRVGPRSQ
jgi:hypothetical protein